ncbi:DUF6415 family natural product biosynthesis protein [Streptomyces sp. NPDC007056]|uniref:DUF6415 family natural product biosynthesis protein n=1 Tax=unclassified Streptomyces TaxID=2593676 RepID=UPI0033D3ED37
MARRLTAARLRFCGLEPLVDDAELIVSELVTNAIQHGAGGQVTFTMTVRDGFLRLAVHCETTGRPVVHHAGDDAEHGRGLFLVNCLASAHGGTWGTSDDGTTTWCCLAIPGGHVVTAPGTARPVPVWPPPLSGRELATVLDGLRRWSPCDGGALLDDVAAVLDDVAPAEEVTEEIAERLRGHLLRLVNIAVAAGAERDPAAAQLTEQARTLRGEDLPGDHWKAIGHLRRLGWTAGELLERLVAVRCLKEAE